MDTVGVVTPGLGGTRALMKSVEPSLVPSERRVVQFCLTDPEAVCGMSVSELARQAGVSPATVVRACKNLGVGGFQRLRELLIRDTAADGDPVVDSTDSDHPLDRVFAHALAGIDGALGALDYGVFDDAARLVAGCDRLLVVGNGGSHPAAQSVALRFLTTGRTCEAPVDVVTQHISAKLTGPGDVCLAVSDSGLNRFMLRSARLAAANGATVIGVTSYAKSELALLATHPLVAGADFHEWNDGTVIGNIAQMLVLSALHTAAMAYFPDADTAQQLTQEEVQVMVHSPQ